ncbi:6735_t:CDS:1, partial [Racocetra persica]
MLKKSLFALILLMIFSVTNSVPFEKRFSVIGSCPNDPPVEISLTPDPPNPNQEFFIGVSQTVSTSISDGFVPI